MAHFAMLDDTPSVHEVSEDCLNEEVKLLSCTNRLRSLPPASAPVPLSDGCLDKAGGRHGETMTDTNLSLQSGRSGCPEPTPLPRMAHRSMAGTRELPLRFWPAQALETGSASRTCSVSPLIRAWRLEHTRLRLLRAAYPAR